MRKVKRWRYYCDHCGRGGCSPGHMLKHERGCTKNPQRICGLCEIAGLTQRPISELVAAFCHEDGDGMERLRVLADNCPACMLATLHQMPSEMLDEDEYGNVMLPRFDFREELRAYEDRVNDACAEALIPARLRGKSRQPDRPALAQERGLVK